MPLSRIQPRRGSRGHLWRWLPGCGRLTKKVNELLYPETRWKFEQQDERAARALAENLNVPPLIARLLIARGITTVEAAERFIHIDKNDFHDPFLLDGMDDVVRRLEQAIRGNEKILVFGDYDADGVSATAIMLLGLRALGAEADYYVPNRFDEGYGPNVPALEKARKEGYSLVVTVDTGIAALEAAEAARHLGLDYIVTDHHEPPPELPDAYAIVNPKKPGCPYPFKSLAGAGVAFKVIHALSGRAPEALLDLAAVGTICDLVPLVDENRLIAAKGLAALSTAPRPGLRALMKVAGVLKQDLTADDIGFGIGPRINAAGRMDDARPAVELLLADSEAAADALAEQLDDYNRERKAVVDQIAAEACAEVERFPEEEKKVLVIARENWHEGVVGIAASRIVETFYRPTIILSIDPETGLAKGSARSIDGFDIYKALSRCRDLLIRFGGHEMAAGMTLSADDIPELSARLNAYADDMLSEADFQPVLRVDLCASIGEVTVSLLETLERLAPFGVGNPKPRIAVRGSALAEIKQIGSDKNHLKMVIKDGDAVLEGVAFKKGELYYHIDPDAAVTVVGALSINDWNGYRKPQIFIDDVKIDEWQLFDWRRTDAFAERLEHIPQNRRLLVYFREETRTASPFSAFQHEMVHSERVDAALAEARPFFVFLDVPDKAADLAEFLKRLPFPERIYAVFYNPEGRFFEALPNREQFKTAYAYIYNKRRVSIVRATDDLAKWRGWHPETALFIWRVFSDLEFVKIESGFLTFVDRPEKKPLSASTVYRARQERIEAEETFCYSGRAALREWFHRIYAEKMHAKEAIL